MDADPRLTGMPRQRRAASSGSEKAALLADVKTVNRKVTRISQDVALATAEVRGLQQPEPPPDQPDHPPADSGR